MANDHIKVQSRNVQSPLSVGSNEVPAIPAVDPLADRRSDGGGDLIAAVGNAGGILKVDDHGG